MHPHALQPFQHQIEESFPYEETPDQAAAIEAVIHRRPTVPLRSEAALDSREAGDP